MKKHKFLVGLLCAMMSTVCFGSETTDKISANLRSRYPATQFTDVRETPVPDLFEVVMGKNVAYTNAEGRYFLFGHFFDMHTQQDLTAQRLDELNTVSFADLPLKDALRTVRGDGKRVLAVFSDPDCPYCKRLENELLSLNNVTIYTFLYPLEGLHPKAPEKAAAIWCARDNSTVWREFMTKDIPPPASKADCDSSAVDRNVALGQRLNINGTPTLISGDGRVMPGAASAGQVDSWLNLMKTGGQ